MCAINLSCSQPSPYFLANIPDSFNSLFFPSLPVLSPLSLCPSDSLTKVAQPGLDLAILLPQLPE